LMGLHGFCVKQAEYSNITSRFEFSSFLSDDWLLLNLYDLYFRSDVQWDFTAVYMLSKPNINSECRDIFFPLWAIQLERAEYSGIISHWELSGPWERAVSLTSRNLPFFPLLDSPYNEII
jgi:hypothetical protein